jgi:hypothetical protein
MLGTALLGLGIEGSAQAASNVAISGFGTAALTMSDTDQAEFARPNQAAGVKKEPRTGVDSNFGVQATYTHNEWLSLTAQGLARKVSTDQFGAQLSMAFIKVKASEEFSVRVGRIGLPVYMVSDFRFVGYANTMMRPPAEVYRSVAADAYDGADVIYQHGLGDVTVTAQVGAGSLTLNTLNGAQNRLRKLTTVNLVAEQGPFALRFGRVDAEVSVVNNAALNNLLAALRSNGFSDQARQLRVDDVASSFTSLGLTMDWKNILFQSEYAVRKTDSLAVHDVTSWYAMLGYRIGKFTPYFYHGNARQESPRSVAGLPAGGPLASLGASANALAKYSLQSANAVGVRWDFYRSAALKVQIDRISPRQSAGAFIKAVPGFTGPANVYAAGIDFVF